MAELAIYLKVFVAVLVLVNPPEGIPIYLAMSRGLSEGERGDAARQAAIAVTLILLGALVIGRELLAILGISIGAFTAAGGVLIFLIALEMVLGPAAASKPASADPASRQRFAIVPLAIPLLAGPGAISSVVVFASRGFGHAGPSLGGDAVLAAVIVVVGIATWASLRAAAVLQRFLGDTGIDVMTRISGILVAAIAVGLLREGLIDLFPKLAA